MGLLENVTTLLDGAGTGVEPVQMLPGERETFRTPGSLGLVVGGDIVVTDQRLLFTPLSTTDLAPLLKAGLQIAGAPGAGTFLVGQLAGAVSRSAASARVAAVRAGREASLAHPPSVVVTDDSGRSLELGVLATRLSANISPRNAEARQRLLEALQAHLSAPDPLPGPAAQVRPASLPPTSSVALTEEEIDAHASVEEHEWGFRIFIPNARARSADAHLDPALAGTWAVAGDDVITLTADGGLHGTMQMFGAMPPGPATGQWWVDGVPPTLVLNLLCVQSEGDQRIEFATSWPLVVRRTSAEALDLELHGKALVLHRLGP